jgi:hypothetical protein
MRSHVMFYANGIARCTTTCSKTQLPATKTITMATLDAIASLYEWNIFFPLNLVSFSMSGGPFVCSLQGVILLVRCILGVSKPTDYVAGMFQSQINSDPRFASRSMLEQIDRQIRNRIRPPNRTENNFLRSMGMTTSHMPQSRRHEISRDDNP